MCRPAERHGRRRRHNEMLSIVGRNRYGWFGDVRARPLGLGNTSIKLCKCLVKWRWHQIAGQTILCVRAKFNVKINRERIQFVTHFIYFFHSDFWQPSTVPSEKCRYWVCVSECVCATCFIFDASSSSNIPNNNEMHIWEEKKTRAKKPNRIEAEKRKLLTFPRRRVCLLHGSLRVPFERWRMENSEKIYMRKPKRNIDAAHSRRSRCSLSIGRIELVPTQKTVT